MTAQLIDGKKLALTLKQRLGEKIRKRRDLGLSTPGLAVILVGQDPASEIYVRNKRRSCAEIGVNSFAYDLPASTSQDQLLQLLDSLNHDRQVHGILLQLPLPDGFPPSDALLEKIDPRKDVDGFHPYNIGRLALRQPTLRPCTPKGVMHLLEHIGQPFKQKHAVVVGASNLVGRPMALELLLAGATVTVCHRFTADLAGHVAQADILISATGKKGLIKGEWIKLGSTVVDVGICRDESGQIRGDVEFESAAERAAWITPVPGGVGPMTVYSLLENTVAAAEAMDSTAV